MTQQLCVSVGCQTQAGIKPINEDAVDFVIPEQDNQIELKGICCVVADGVSSAEAGQQASQIAVSRFTQDYFQTPDTWSVSHAGQKILSAINLSLFKKSHEFKNEEKGYLCTFEGMIFKSQTAHFFHVGDSRIQLYRDGEFKQLTRDHCAVISESKSYLTRALGMDNNLHVDYGKLALRVGDKFILSSDGVHEFISQSELKEILDSTMPAQDKAEKLVALALENGSDDNLSCILADVEAISNQSLDDFNTQLTRLPFPPELEPGMKLDGYRVEDELFASSRSQLYLVTDEQTGERLVMKTPSVNFCQDTAYIDRFIQEEWIGKRIDSERVVDIISQQRPRTCLYYIMEWLPGVGLDKWMRKHPFPSPKRAIAIIKQVAEGLEAFHEKETIHQDLKPANIIVDDNDNIKIVDFGSTFVAGTAEIFKPLVHEGALGTASYSDPNYLLGKNTGIQGDLYALATICYELFTGKLPYGEKIDECQSHHEFDRLRYHSASTYNPVIPIWFDRAIEKGVKIDLEQRYVTIEQLLQDLTHPNPDFLLDVPEAKADRSKATFWMMLSGFWVLMLAAVFSMFSGG